jgi:hypothetical protein
MPLKTARFGKQVCLLPAKAMSFVLRSEIIRNENALNDQDNALGTWQEHGPLGTQLGPNKNGKKW